MAVMVEIRGKKFPLCLTVAALDPIREKCDGLANIYRFINGYPEDTEDMDKEQAEIATLEAANRSKENVAWMLGLLIREGEENRLMEARFETDGDTTRRPVPGPEEMVHLLKPNEALAYYLPVYKAITDSMLRKLEATPKNGYQGAEG